MGSKRDREKQERLKKITTENPKEKFVPIVGFEDLYQVSNFGRVLSLGRVKCLKWLSDTGGSSRGRIYPYVHLCRDGKQRKYRVHLLVFEHFCGPIPAGYDIDHIDGNKQNPKENNLRLLTRSDNLKAHQNSMGGTSKYRGVYEKKGRWIAALTSEGKKIHIGSYDTEDLAAQAFNDKAVELGFQEEALNKINYESL